MAWQKALKKHTNENEQYIGKEDKKYTRYLDGILKEYSVKQTSSDRQPYEFEESSPKEIKTGTVTQIGHREISNWTNYYTNTTSNKSTDSIKRYDHRTLARHSLTKLRGATLFNSIKNRPQETLEEDFESILNSIPSSSYFLSPEKCKTLNLSTPAKGKGGMRSYVSLFDVETPSHEEDQLTTSTSRKNSSDSLTSGITLPQIVEPPEKSKIKPLFIQTTDLKETSPNPDLSKPTSLSNSPSVPPLSSHSKKKNRRTLLHRKSSQTMASSPSSNRPSKQIALKRRTSSAEIYSENVPVLPPGQVKKYFGNESKINFYETYREISHLKDNLVGGTNEIEKYITVSERDYDKEIDELSSVKDGGRSYISAVSSIYDEMSSIQSSDHLVDSDEFDDDLSFSQESPSKSTHLSNTTIKTSSSKRSFAPSSPRAKYIAGCIKNHVPPRSSILLRENMTSCLMLEHQGIGDTMGELLSTGLLDIPFLSAVNIADNNLTDKSLQLIIQAISNRQSITELNISRNKVGSETATALGIYLRSNKCTLKKLSMRASNVDDHECHQFVEALGYNRCLEVNQSIFSDPSFFDQELDLSENLLGKDENLNAVKPDTITAGESFAILLHDCRCPIRTLKIAWNMIRMEGAIQFCSSLQYQKFLRHLDISFNSLGREGGIVLGNSLLDNNVMEELLISNNSIDGAACFAICVGVREGKSVRYLNIDGNPIGEAGARILMSLPSSCGAGIVISARNCDLTMRQTSCWFDITNPVCENILLDLTNGYDLAVMYEILDLIARHPSYQFGSVQYGDDVHTKQWKDLRYSYYEEKRLQFSHAESDTLSKLKKTVQIADDLDLCVKYFQACDTDNSGELSEDEFFDIVDRIGLSLSVRQKINAMSLYDSDHSGAIQLDEFKDFINEVAKDSRLRIRDIETSARCAESSSPNQRYFPPRRGIFKITITNGYITGGTCRALTEEQVKNIIHMAKNSSSPATLIQYAAETDLLRLAEAHELVNHLVTECGDMATALAAIIPHMTSTTDAKNLITLCSNNDENTQLKLKLQFGNAYRPLTGLVDGYYSLDFSRSSDRLCMTKLLELSTTAASERRDSNLGDVSQDGNWSGFRNEYFSGREVRLSTAALSPMPTSGKIEFDFLTSARPIPSVICLTDRKIIQILIQMNLLPTSLIHWAYDELTELRTACRKSLSTSGSSPYWNSNLGRLIEAQKYKFEKFYSNLSSRSEQLDRAIKREQRYAAVLTEAITASSTKPKSLQRSLSTAASTSFLSDGTDEEGVSSALLDPDEDFEALSPLTPPNKSLVRMLSGPRDMGKDSELAISNGPQSSSLCAKILDQLEQLLINKWIFVRQLILIMKCFRMGSLKKTDFGTYRVELIVALFSRLKDSHNFHLIFACLTTEEHGMLLARIGMLNIFDPLRPEGAYSLDLSIWEERQVCKMLIHIAAAEPGSNWAIQLYQFDRLTRPSTGWALTVNWYTEDGLPNKGIVSLGYTCGSGVRLNGCFPVINHRQSLVSLVLHRLELYYSEECNYTPIIPEMKKNCTMDRANEMLRQAANISWSYNPLRPCHE